MDSTQTSADLPGNQANGFPFIASPLLKEVDALMNFIDNFDHLNVLLLKMKLIYLQQQGGIFNLKPSEIEDLSFLVNFLEQCQALKSKK